MVHKLEHRPKSIIENSKCAGETSFKERRRGENFMQNVTLNATFWNFCLNGLVPVLLHYVYFSNVTHVN